MPTDETRPNVMTLDEFKTWFVSKIDWSPPEIFEENDLVEDLGMDSVGAVYLMTAIEDAVGGDVIMPIELMLQITTVRDAYLQYCAFAHLPYEGAAPRWPAPARPAGRTAPNSLRASRQRRLGI